MEVTGQPRSSGLLRGPGLMYENGPKSEEGTAPDQALKKERQIKAEEDQESPEWRANRLQELRTSLRKANRAMETGWETQTAIKEFTLLQENLAVVPPAVLGKLTKENKTGASSSGSFASRASAPPLRNAPSTRSSRVDELLKRNAELQQRVAVLLRRVESERQVQPRQETEGGNSRRSQATTKRTQVPSPPRGVPESREELSKSSKKGRILTDFRESRRLAAAHGIVVFRTLPKPAPDPRLQAHRGRPEDHPVSRGINGLMKPAKRWIGGKVYVEKHTGISTVRYTPPGRAEALDPVAGTPLVSDEGAMISTRASSTVSPRKRSRDDTAEEPRVEPELPPWRRRRVEVWRELLSRV